MRTPAILVMILCALSLLNCGTSPNKSTTENRSIGLEITTSQNSDSLEQFAVAEFDKYFGEIFGNQADAKVHIAKSENASSPHQVRYYVKDNALRIEGGSSKSTLYAVYTFLEIEMGCRFLDPTTEIIPKQNAFKMKDWSYDYTPEITTRTVHSSLFYENPIFANKHKVTDLAFPRYVPKARVHTFQHFMPAEDYFEEHPEYYALHDGKRKTTQLCLTNEKVFEIVLDSVRQFLADSPDSEVISVSQDDNSLYCHCENCEAIHKKEESAAGSMIYFVNKIARAVPDKQISTLAYQYTRKAPKHIIPEKNVLITLCSIECDRSDAIENKCQDFSRDLVEWGKISDNIRIWDYTTQFTNFLAPFPNLRTLQPNIQLFRDNSAKWVFEQHSRNPSELFELRSYLTAKLLWNPDGDVDSMINDFLSNYYEDAAPFVDSYIERIHDEIRKDSTFFLFLYGDPAQGFRSFLSAENLKEYDRLFNQAENKAGDNQDLLDRVNRARISTDYATLEFYKTKLRTVLQEDAQAVTERIARFRNTAEQGEISYMNEMGFKVNEYLEQYAQTINRAGQSTMAYKKPVTLLTAPKKYANEDPQVLTDGAYGGSNFYANWLGFEGNDLEAVIDLGEVQTVSEISSAFLQVTNHIVFFPESVEYLGSVDGNNYSSIVQMNTQDPLSKASKINSIEYFEHQGSPKDIRFVKIKASNMKVAPEWHNASGSPAWIFMDEVHVN